MGMFGNNLSAECDGVKILVDSSFTGIGSRTRLIINGVKADEAECAIFGMVRLCGALPKAEKQKQVLLEVRQHPFHTRFTLFVDGQKVDFD